MERIARQAGRFLATGEAVPPPPELPPILSLCKHNNLLPLLAYRMKNASVDLPADVLEDLNRADRNAVARRSLVLGALEDALELLAPRRAVLFKGLAVAESWPSPHFRDPGDIDLLVPVEMHGEAAGTLLAHGWTEERTIHIGVRELVARKYGFARVFRHPERPVIVDLHSAPVDRTEPFWMNPQPLHENSIETTLSGGVNARVPLDEHHLALMALHAVRHGTFRMQNFLDLHFFCCSKRINNIEISAYARRENIFRAVSVSRRVATELLGVQPWGAGSDEGAAIRRAAEKRNPAVIARGHMTVRGGTRRMIALIDLIDDPVSAIRYMWRLAFPKRSLLVGRAGSSGIVSYMYHRFLAAASLLRRFERKENDS